MQDDKKQNGEAASGAAASGETESGASDEAEVQVQQDVAPVELVLEPADGVEEMLAGEDALAEVSIDVNPLDADNQVIWRPTRPDSAEEPIGSLFHSWILTPRGGVIRRSSLAARVPGRRADSKRR